MKPPTNLEYEARSYIDWYTFRRLVGEETIPDEVKECMYHLIRLIEQRLALLSLGSDSESGSSSMTGGTGIASQSNDGVSISFNTLSAKDILDANTETVNRLVQRSLDGIRNSLGHRLLYRGIYPGEEVK